MSFLSLAIELRKNLFVSFDLLLVLIKGLNLHLSHFRSGFFSTFHVSWMMDVIVFTSDGLMRIVSRCLLRIFQPFGHEVFEYTPESIKVLRLSKDTLYLFSYFFLHIFSVFLLLNSKIKVSFFVESRTKQTKISLEP
jgi:hypothetical protein